jgi:spermidine synthase
MKIRISKLISWLYPVQLEKVRGELGHDLEVNVNNGKIVLDTATVNYSYGKLQDIFDYAFQRTSLYNQQIHTALIPGFGSGSVSHLLHHKCDPSISVTGIEADKEVIRLAKKYFPEARKENVRIIHSDASEYLTTSSDNFDLVVVDVFVNDEVPASCQSIDFFSRIKAHLNMQGKIYVNKMYRKNDRIKPKELEHNIRAVFRDVQVIPVPGFNAQNYIYVATRKRKHFEYGA